MDAIETLFYTGSAVEASIAQWRQTHLPQPVRRPRRYPTEAALQAAVPGPVIHGDGGVEIETAGVRGLALFVGGMAVWLGLMVLLIEIL